MRPEGGPGLRSERSSRPLLVPRALRTAPHSGTAPVFPGSGTRYCSSSAALGGLQRVVLRGARSERRTGLGTAGHSIPHHQRRHRGSVVGREGAGRPSSPAPAGPGSREPPQPRPEHRRRRSRDKAALPEPPGRMGALQAREPLCPLAAGAALPRTGRTQRQPPALLTSLSLRFTFWQKLLPAAPSALAPQLGPAPLSPAAVSAGVGGGPCPHRACGAGRAA